MPKKCILYLLILFILNFTGCTYLEVISKEDVDGGRAEINLNDELYLTTKDFTRYHFLAYTYRITNDTLYGIGTMENSTIIIPFNGAVAFNDVINFEQKKTDTGATLGLIGGIIAVGILVGVILYSVALSDAINPN